MSVISRDFMLHDDLVPDPNDIFTAREPAAHDARHATEQLALSPDDFWSLIELLGGEADEHSTAMLSERLAEEPRERILGFEASLTLALFALDTEVAYRWYAAHDPHSAAVGVSDDVFLYARCATVASGRAVWEQAVRDGSLPATGGPDSGEDLLLVAANAIDEDTDAWHPDVIPLDYETGSNGEGWPAG